MKTAISANQAQQVLAHLLASKAGRAKIASVVQGSLRTIRDYTSIGRRALMLDDLPDGAIPVYDRDPMIYAYTISESSDSVLSYIGTDRITVPMYELASLPTIPFSRVKERRFDVIKRMKDRATSELFREEDRRVFAVLKLAGSNNPNNPVTTIAATDFGMDDLADAFAVVEKNDLRVDKIFIHPNQVPAFRKAGRDYLDFETQRELLRVGYLGTLWGAQVHYTMMLPAGTVFIVSEPEYVGVLPERIQLTVYPADEPRKREFGWSIFENIGTSVHNANGVALVSVT